VVARIELFLGTSGSRRTSFPTRPGIGTSWKTRPTRRQGTGASCQGTAGVERVAARHWPAYVAVCILYGGQESNSDSWAKRVERRELRDGRGEGFAAKERRVRKGGMRGGKGPRGILGLGSWVFGLGTSGPATGERSGLAAKRQMKYPPENGGREVAAPSFNAVRFAMEKRNPSVERCRSEHSGRGQFPGRGA
jgi:hypothetical protein